MPGSDSTDLFQISFQGTDRVAAVEIEVRAWLLKLQALISDSFITQGRVVIKAVNQHRHGKGCRYHVGIDMTAPTGEIAIGRDQTPELLHEDVCVAIRDAFRALRKRLLVQPAGAPAA